jgi:PAS domain S-box-containing protein
LGFIGMAVTSLEKGWIDVNNKLWEILGYSQEELIELSWAEITYPDDLEAYKFEFERVLAGETQGYSMDKRFIRKDGEVIFASISANSIRKGNGSVDHFVVFVQDINEHKQAEELTKKTYGLLKEAEKLAHIGSWEWDVEEDKFTMSDEWLRMHGVTKKNLTMDELLPIAHPDDAKAIEKNFKEALNGLRTYELTHRFIRQDTGEVRFVNSKGIVSFDKQGKPYKVLGTVQDITERKLIEKELEEHRDNLETLVKNRTHDLTKVN